MYRPYNSFYDPVNRYLKVNPYTNSYFYYDDPWGVFGHNKKKSIVSDLNTSANPFSPSQSPLPSPTIESFFDLDNLQECYLE